MGIQGGVGVNKVYEYCLRGIIQYLDGNEDKFENYVRKAMELDEHLCECGNRRVTAKYERESALLCTGCGRVYVGRKVVRKCLVNSRRVS